MVISTNNNVHTHVSFIAADPLQEPAVQLAAPEDG